MRCFYVETSLFHNFYAKTLPGAVQCKNASPGAAGRRNVFMEGRKGVEPRENGVFSLISQVSSRAGRADSGSEDIARPAVRPCGAGDGRLDVGGKNGVV